MTLRRLIDPELRETFDALPALELSAAALPDIRREATERPAERVAQAATFPGISVSTQYIAGPAGAPDVRVLVYRPGDVQGMLPGLLWIHGGGYVLGNAADDAATVKALIAEIGCVVVAVDYRLAPETPHPGPIEDCYTALKWLHHNAENLGVDSERIAIGGESAGGGLTAALAILARDRGEIAICFQVLIYPMLDDRTAADAAAHPLEELFTWSSRSNAFGWTALLGQAPGSPDVPPYAAAARASDLRGVPGAFLCIGALDLFVDENVAYAQRLIRAGVPTELHVYPGAFHGFPIVASAHVTQAYKRDLYTALRRAFTRSPERHLT